MARPFNDGNAGFGQLPSPLATTGARASTSSSPARRSRMLSPSSSTPIPSPRRSRPSASAAPEVTLLSRSTLTFHNESGELSLPSLRPDKGKQAATEEYRPFPVPSYLLQSTQYARFTTAPGVPARTAAEEELDDPYAPSTDPIFLPTRWDPKNCCDLLEMSPDGLTVSFRGSGKNGEKDAAAVKADRPIPLLAGVYYFEVEIAQKGQCGFIGVGFSGPSVSLTRLPGWEDNSFGYHGDDGHSFSSNGTGVKFGPTFTTGDVIGCGIDWSCGRAFFTKNGSLIAFCFSNLKGPLYPSVGLRTPGEVVKANFGQSEFRFDIEQFAADRKAAVEHDILHWPLSDNYLDPADVARGPDGSTPRDLSSTMASLVQSYLRFHAYAESAQAFERERRAEVGNFADLSSLVASTSAVPMDTDEPAASEQKEVDDAMLVRRRIINLIEGGQPLAALADIQANYPTLDERRWTCSIAFHLRTRRVIDLLIQADSAGDETFESMAEDEPSHATAGKAADIETSDSYLDQAVQLLQELYAEVRPLSSDPSAWVMWLDALASLLSYTDLSDVKDPMIVAWLDSKTDRQRIAAIVNGRLLEHHGLKDTSPLGHIAQRARAVLQKLSEKRDGAGALVHPVP